MRGLWKAGNPELDEEDEVEDDDVDGDAVVLFAFAEEEDAETTAGFTLLIVELMLPTALVTTLSRYDAKRF